MSDSANNEKTREVTSGGEVRPVPLNFRVPETVVTHYVNEVAVQALHTEFILSFFELQVPIGVQGAPESLNANCVARVAMSAERIPDVLKTLKTQFDRFLKDREAIEKEDKKEVVS